MEEMILNLRNEFLRGLLAKVVKALIRKNTGKDVTVSVESIRITVENGKTKVSINAELGIENSDLEDLIKKALRIESL